MPLTSRSAAIGAAAIAALGLGGMLALALRPPADPFAACRSGVVAGGAGAVGGPFTLTDETGRKVTQAEVITGPTLVYFGYTFCPDVCPLDMARTAEAVERLEEAGVSVLPVFISVDPARDTPQVLREFTDALHPRMLGLTGTEAEVAAAAKAYRSYFRVQTPGDPYTLVDHSTQTYLMMPAHGFVDFFNRDASAADMAEKVACYVAAAQA